MRKIFLIFAVAFAFCSAKAQSSDPILMKIGDNVVTKSEFEYIYFKNNSANTLDKKNLDEYVELFKKFKLKVLEAQALGLDTLPSFKREYRGYRAQIVEPYLVDKDMDEQLAREQYQRLLEDVELSIISLQLPRDASPADTLAAYKQMIEVEKRLKKEDFAKVAREFDNSAKENGGHIGWLTGQMVVYPLEKAMYAIPVGKISAPIRTPYGYHIIKVLARRPAVGKVQVAHILKQFPQNATPEEQENTYKQILEIANKIKQGEDFAKLAQNSDDKSSARNGGILQPFGVNRMVPEFEKAAFALKNAGDISEPIKSQFGWHIIKLIDKKSIAPYEELREEILKTFKRDERSNAGRKTLAEKIKKEYNYEFYNANFNEVLEYAKKCVYTDTALLENAENFQKPLFKIGDKIVPQNRFIYYVYGSTNNIFESAPEQTMKHLNPFIEQEVIAYEDANLEKKYPDLKNLLQEYHDGILLFNISNEMVWEKAVKDKEGLEKYFKQNADNYTFSAPTFKGRIFYSKDKKIAAQVQKAIKKMPADDIAAYLKTKINVDTLLVTSEVGLWKKGEHKAIDKFGFKDKTSNFTPSKEFPFVFVQGKVLTKPDSYTDVRGAVTSDYQNFLEEEWIKSLFEKYKVEINSAVLKEVELDSKTYFRNND